MDRDELLRLRYQEAIAQLRLHPQLIWTRNNFFLLVQTAFLAVVASSGPDTPSDGTAFICVAGLFTALIWVWVNFAGRTLQRQWRKLVVEFETDLFASLADEGVTGPFSQSSADIGEGKAWSVSITSALLILAAGFVLIWVYMLVGLL